MRAMLAGKTRIFTSDTDGARQNADGARIDCEELAPVFSVNDRDVTEPEAKEPMEKSERSLLFVGAVLIVALVAAVIAALLTK